MDNILGQRNKQAARDFTEEIERATNQAVLQGDGFASNADFDRGGNSNSDVNSGNDIDSGNTAIRENEAALGAQAIRGVISSGQLESMKVAEDQLVEEDKIRAYEAVRQAAAEENGYVQSGLEGGANVVGGESSKEMRERLRDDEEDRRLEDDDDLSSEELWAREKVMDSQDKLTASAVARIDKIIDKESFHPQKLVRERRLGMHAILATYGRKFGERN